MHKERVKYSEISSFYNHIYKALTIIQIQHYLLGEKIYTLYSMLYYCIYTDFWNTATLGLRNELLSTLRSVGEF